MTAYIVTVRQNDSKEKCLGKRRVGGWVWAKGGRIGKELRHFFTYQNQVLEPGNMNP